ncbi:YbhB/YbcL family Raf kinase inhibitor-like protein [Duganella radicis]|uniref:YbhB/YbcL family Raf kinase inhibitor-like protein n=1 Tax=Duganella radicis TaxID=551988 RepID=A0A6L6PI56_9BURK|nr:YbhB/YbcL family Raf kinase inhibitor-like protein [Duganella radicis]MTV38237.1 YbhB/YbcL family Raf kinase inhibitor-like protein [Duganella radicis]
MNLTSDSFREHGAIPAVRSPQLSWDEVPAGTGSLALVCLDADAPADFFLWCVADIPPMLTWLDEGTGLALRHGLNDYGGFGYHGPRLAPNQTHQYIFRLYALDVVRLELPARFTGGQLLDAIYGHIIDEAQLIGAYTQT